MTEEAAILAPEKSGHPCPEFASLHKYLRIAKQEKFAFRCNFIHKTSGLFVFLLHDIDVAGKRRPVGHVSLLNLSIFDIKVKRWVVCVEEKGL